MSKSILLGDEAVALGAIHAGISAAYSYPGTPASEIMEYLIKSSEEGRKFKASWSVNEKVAYEEALGVSFAGKRSMASFKHVGLNVAADPFMNSAMTGANGGLLVVSADDPGMHSSQNEQDSRFFAQFAQILCLEPSDHQEAYDMTREAFDLSETMGLPVLLRVVTRLSHSRSTVETREPRGQNGLKYGDWKDWTLLPANARRRLGLLVEKQAGMREFADSSPFNALRLNAGDRSLGVVASGIGHNYLRESLKGTADVPSVLKLGTYPVPEKLLARLVDSVDTILVVEEGYPLIEKSLKGFFGIHGKDIRGKMSGHLPPTGELSPDLVGRALGLKLPDARPAAEIRLAGRPPQLCAGCPHADTLRALNKALEGHPAANVFSDIGCYTLGALPPYSAVKTCVCMGASVGMAKGGSDAGIRPSVAVIGDSTFAHSGITPLLGAAAENTDMTVIILDNAIVAMTGGQPSLGSGGRLLRILEGVGVPGEHIRVIEPLPKNQEKNIQVMREEIAHKGLSVIVSARD
ncbi:MAG: thiamine pyrophosphate-dependent enzyme [Acidobacteriota bacterium]|nr:thiamine pyrophosphate-dependent enzyme [Acidobacteriota bacterium]